MCGIVGWVDWIKDLTAQDALITVEEMANRQKHRGPDMKGHWQTARAAFAHHRLAVIDPLCEAQPFVYTTGNYIYALTYNGEIYNFRELRHELEQRGHTFRTQTDTEVLLHSYIEWQEDCVQRFNGIFAFGLWDEARQTLLLARDHLGVKPLFYAQRGSAVLFASEIKALLAHPLVQPVIDKEGMAEILKGGLGHTPGTGVFRQIYEVRPGYMHIFAPEDYRTIQYWSLQSAPHNDDTETTATFIRSLLEDTVKRQLIADVPLVAMLSGGLDSSGLTALASREKQSEGQILDTYSIDFEDSAAHFYGTAIRPSLDAPWVQRVSAYAGTHHHTVTVDTPELIENMLIPMYAHDLPAIGQLETSLYLLFKEMKRDATVAISGESADEVFGGYPWFYDPQTLNAHTFPWLASNEWNPHSIDDHSSSWLTSEAMQQFQPIEYTQQKYEEALQEVPRLESDTPEANRMREIFYLNLTRFLPMLLDRKDRMSMACGFEVRVPFCDHRLVQYVWNIPWEMKTVGHIEKGILRQALQGILPDDVRMRRKSAYPSMQNPSYIQALQHWIHNILNDKQAPLQPFMNTAMVQRLATSENLPQTERTVFLLERIIQINSWLTEYHVEIRL